MAPPLAAQVPADWSDKIMHGRLMVGDQVLMGADAAPDRYEEPKGFSMSLHIKSIADALAAATDAAIERWEKKPGKPWSANGGSLQHR